MKISWCLNCDNERILSPTQTHPLGVVIRWTIKKSKYCNFIRKYFMCLFIVYVLHQILDALHFSVNGRSCGQSIRYYLSFIANIVCFFLDWFSGNLLLVVLSWIKFKVWSTLRERKEEQRPKEQRRSSSLRVRQRSSSSKEQPGWAQAWRKWRRERQPGWAQQRRRS